MPVITVASLTAVAMPAVVAGISETNAMYEVVLRDWIWAAGRGPELRRVHHLANGIGLVAIDYGNPDYASEADLKHLIFHRVQVHVFTPEEVHNYAGDEVRWGPSINQAAAVNLGKSAWLLSFAQRHLVRCNHYRLMFYDEYLDVICEGISAEAGPYRGQSKR